MITGYNLLEETENNTFKGTPWYDNLPDGVVYLGKVLFQYKGSMPENTTITVKDGTTSIGNGAFDNCVGLVGINIPKSVNRIGWSSNFKGCTNLTSIKVASENTTFDSRDNCNAIINTAKNTMVAGCNSTTIPSSVKAIDHYVIHNSDIRSIVIPDNIETIGIYSFYDCKLLESVRIGKGLKSIGESSFHFCPKLKVSISKDNPFYDSREDCNCIIETASDKLIAGALPANIPTSVKVIGEYAFDGDAEIVVVPDGVEKIEMSAFSGIFSLQKLVIGKNVKTIRKNAFHYCDKLQVIYSLAVMPAEIEETSFDNNVSYNATLFVPIGSKIKYEQSTGWNKFKNIIEFDPNTFDPAILSVQGIIMDVNDDNTPIYNLRGQRLSSPQKGINIINGKKVIVK